MIKVLVNGGLFKISKAEEIVEKRVPFNGANMRLIQISRYDRQNVSVIVMPKIAIENNAGKSFESEETWSLDAEEDANEAV